MKPTTRPRLLDLFCGAGGAAMGYYQAGFDVVGVDIKPQPRYPFEFHQGNALEYLAQHGRDFDAIHASPPCQAYSVTAPLSNGRHKRLVELTREEIIKIGLPYIIENVIGAPLLNPLMLCGTMFGLAVLRHRIFECNPPIWFAPGPCQHVGLATGNHLRRTKNKTHTPGFRDGYTYITVAGNNYLCEDGKKAMAIDWMNKAELTQAIPPAYTEYIGGWLMQNLQVRT